MADFLQIGLLSLSLLTVASAGGPFQQKEFLHLNKTCGRPPEGSNKVGEAPWAVSITHARKWYPGMGEELIEKYEELICSGVLISNRHVLTAASCLVPIEADCLKSMVAMRLKNLQRLRVHMGGSCSHKTACDNLGQKEPSETKEVKQAFMASYFVGKFCLEYKMDPYEGDVLVLELTEDVEFSHFVYPACLTPFMQFSGNHSVTVAGYPISDWTEGDEDQTGLLTSFEETISSLPTQSLYAMGELENTNYTCEEMKGSGGVMEVEGRATVQFILGNCHEQQSAKKVEMEANNITANANITTTEETIEKSNSEEKMVATYANLIGHVHWICHRTGLCPQGRGIQNMYDKLPDYSRPKWSHILRHLPYEKLFVL